MLDENNEVIRNSIIWCDGRTTKECREIEEIIGRDRLMEITCNPALEGFTAGKIRWVQKNEPENYAGCRHILLPKDYIRFMLTGEYATEVSDASGMQLLDIEGRCWSREVCDKLGIDMSLLAKVYESPEATGYITEEASALTGLKKGVVVAGGAGDNAAAAIGAGVCKSGKAFTTIGTSGVVFAHTDKPIFDKNGRIHTFCCAVPGKWHVMGVTQAAGLSLNWFRGNLAKDISYKELDMQSAEIKIGSDKLIYLPYLMGERTPILDVNSRGVFFGLSAIHTKKDMLRAVMEGVAYSLRDCVEICREMNINVSDMMACGGGGTSPLWRQMLADLYACPVKTASSKEGPALGVGILAAVGAGIYSSVPEACGAIVKTDKIQAPVEANVGEYEKYYQLYREIYPALKAQFAKLAVL
jgi:xylulokinase